MNTSNPRLAACLILAAGTAWPGCANAEAPAASPFPSASTAAPLAPAASPAASPVAPATTAPAPASFAPSPVPASSAKAIAIADEVMKALGGSEAWAATRFLRFDFGVERDGVINARAHTWDKHTGRYRLEAKTREGKPYLVLMNVNTREGSAWLEGQKLSGEEEKKQLEQAYGAWINDTYWLLMPYKLRDPGVILTDGGESSEGGGPWDVLQLSFEGVGLTPKDKYWIYVNKSTRLVDRWDYVLKGEQVPPTSWLWKGWTRKGNIMLAPERINDKDKRRIAFPVLDVPESVPDTVFTTP
jgi:hypothetical protein